jgi:hypothetical protein
LFQFHLKAGRILRKSNKERKITGVCKGTQFDMAFDWIIACIGAGIRPALPGIRMMAKYEDGHQTTPTCSKQIGT